MIVASDQAVADPQGLSANRMRLRVLTAPGGAKYTAIARFEGPTPLRLLYRHPNTFWMHVALAMAISACFALLLAAYITAPLARIRASARRVARGDLSAHIGDLRFGRSAEILALASEFRPDDRAPARSGRRSAPPDPRCVA
jgi:two-component system sensor histidine kinase CpxA